MSEEILKALTQLFGIITRQDGGITDPERQYVINFFQQELDRNSVTEYTRLYDQYTGYNQPSQEKEKTKTTSVKDSLKTLGICKKINRTLAQKQKVIVLTKLFELCGSDKHFTPQRMEIINTVSSVFNILQEEYRLIEKFVVAEASSELDNDNILVIDRGAEKSAEKQKHVHGHLDGFLSFMRVKSVDMFFAKYVGSESTTLNSFIMQPQRIYLFSHGSTIKTQADDALYYSEIVADFNEEIKTIKLSFNASIEEFKFPNGTIGLRNVLLSEGPGKLIGIMGASGAGKTTLLNVLAGLEKPTKGQVAINGFDIHKRKKEIEGVVGFVSQDDLLIEELTVYQNLYYNAKLCFANYTEKQFHDRVMEVLEDLGLEQRKDLKVGSILNKRISGGQRKRLNIALELIREPAVLFLDEPTSGLSSRDSENVIDLLKELSSRGKLVIMVIHQPSSDIYKMFDKMLIMDTGGYPAYYGNPVGAITYFKKQTLQADSDRGQCEICGNVNPEQIFNIIEAKVVDEYGQPTAKRKITPPQWYDLFRERFKFQKVEEVKEKPPQSLRLPGKLKQVLIFTIRDFLSKISNRQYVIINLLEAPLLAFILAFVIKYRNIANGQDYVFRYNDNFPAYLLMAILVALFMGATESAEEIIHDRKILKRESFLNLSWNSYLVSKLAILFSLSAFQTLTFVLLGNWILEIKGMTFAFWVVLFSVSCSANVIGLVISSAFQSAVTAYVLIPLLLIPQIVLSGLLFSFDKLNDLLSSKGKVPVVADLIVSRWAYEAMAVHQFMENEFERHYYEYEKEQALADFKAAFLAEELKQQNHFVLRNFESTNDSVIRLTEKKIDILRHTLSQETMKLPLTQIETLTSQNYSKDAGAEISQYLDQYKKNYQKIYNDNSVLIERKMEFLIKQYGKDITEEKNSYYNESLADLVKNVNADDRMIEYEGKLLQQINPVFQDPRPAGFLDYRTAFFAPKKSFCGIAFTTMQFNLLMIWLMTFITYVMLYFEFVRKVVDSFGNIHLPKQK